jgi:hypothetical protein
MKTYEYLKLIETDEGPSSPVRTVNAVLADGDPCVTTWDPQTSVRVNHPEQTNRCQTIGQSDY